MTAPVPLVLQANPVTIADVVDVARQARHVEIGSLARSALTASRAVVEAALNDGSPHYGINTGFGSLSRERIPTQALEELQRNLVRSHACGVGEPLPVEVVRAMMVLLAASLCRGMSGVRAVIPEQICRMLNGGLTPVVPSIGSVGASGDLAPLAHIALTLIGEGSIAHLGKTSPAREALAAANISPATLEAKEGLALINGTHLMAAQGALLCHDAERTFEVALLAAAMSMDACRATDAFLDPRVHAARNQPGQQIAAARLREHLRGSQIIPSHRDNDPRVQDPYSLRCIPQVLGAAHDCLGYVKQALTSELGGVTDNPLVFAAEPAPTADFTHPESIVSAGNFHGMPLAIPLDTLTIALAHIAGISERRTFWMLASLDPEAHLKPYLTPQPGLNSGLMIAQYTAAACCNEIITLATPASVSNIVTSAGIEDYNSFGPRAAAKARRALELTQTVIAIELLCAAQGLEYHRPLRSGEGVERAHALVRGRVPPLTADRVLATDINAVLALVREGSLVSTKP
jgi:histidine ammonia-lyase